jgi:hypothetical protein
MPDSMIELAIALENETKVDRRKVLGTLATLQLGTQGMGTTLDAEECRVMLAIVGRYVSAILALSRG